MRSSRQRWVGSYSSIPAHREYIFGYQAYRLRTSWSDVIQSVTHSSIYHFTLKSHYDKFIPDSVKLTPHDEEKSNLLFHMKKSWQISFPMFPKKPATVKSIIIMDERIRCACPIARAFKNRFCISCQLRSWLPSKSQLLKAFVSSTFFRDLIPKARGLLYLTIFLPRWTTDGAQIRSTQRYRALFSFGDKFDRPWSEPELFKIFSQKPKWPLNLTLSYTLKLFFFHRSLSLSLCILLF